MHRRRNLLGAAILLLLAGAVILALWFIDTRTTAGTPLPTMATNRTRIRVELKDPSQKEVVREVTYAADGETRVNEKVVFTNGDHAVYKYESDGQTLSSEQLVREDGSLARSGTRLPDGSYELLVLAGDGSTVVDDQITDKDNTLVSENTFRTDGSLSSTFHKGADGSVKIGFSRSGVRLWTIVQGADFLQTATYYSADGKQVIRRFVEGSSSTLGYYYSANGQLEQLREFVGAEMIVTVYDNGRAAYKQTWFQDGTTSSSGTPGYTLNSVSVLDAGGTEVTRYEGFDGKTMTPQTVTRPDPDQKGRSLVETYSASGTLESVAVVDAGGNIVSTRSVPASEDVHLKFDRRFFEPLAYEPPTVPIATPYYEPHGGL